MTPFEVINIINEKKAHDRDEAVEDYVAFLTNKTFSQTKDTVHLANEMNAFYSLDKDMQFDFYMGMVPKGKRFGKWHKPEKSEDVDIVAEYYCINKKIASQYLTILSNEQLDNIKNKMIKGGSHDNKRRSSSKS